ncbi:dTDP-4-dehydrorhamnose 3,5-epimerase [Nitrobacter sp. JJSN]|uniref:dTDP-4-dehydrorhamnose 3,5-epimerase n=1 Tax=Nitrobacter sp. JJSN TaxID=3453033 RepID=UPI003F75EB8E
MKFTPLAFEGAFRIQIEPIVDGRGFFARRFCAEEFRVRGLEDNLIQRSVSFNRHTGTIRGMHFQAVPHLETKLVRCTRGAVFDVMVDLRKDSSSYGKWYGEVLSADNMLMLYIPRGFAHGFQTLADDTEVDYEISPAYVLESARGFRFDDPSVGIDWPIANVIVSDRDKSLPMFLELK